MREAAFASARCVIRASAVSAAGVIDASTLAQDFYATRETPAVRARDPQRTTREGQVGPFGAAERLVVPMNPGNSGGGKGPHFFSLCSKGRKPGDWHEPNNPRNGWETPDGTTGQSESGAELSVLRAVRQGVPSRRAVPCLPMLSSQPRLARGGWSVVRGRRGVRG